MQGYGAFVQTGECTQRGKTMRHSERGIRVQRCACALVPGVHGVKQVQDFRAATLPHHKPIGCHTQSLHQQVSQRDLSGAFGVRGTGFEAHRMRMLRAQFRGIFQDHEAFPGFAFAQKRVEKRGFSGTGSPADDKVLPPRNHGAQGLLGRRIKHAAFAERGKCQTALGGQTNRQVCVLDQRRNDRVNTPTGVVVHVVCRMRRIEPAAVRPNETVGELAYLRLGLEGEGYRLGLSVRLNPHILRGIHVNIGDSGNMCEGFKRTQTVKFGVQAGQRTRYDVGLVLDGKLVVFVPVHVLFTGLLHRQR